MEKSAGGHRAWPDCADLRRCNSRTAFGSPCAGRGESTDEISSAERDYPPWNRSAGRCELSRLLYGARASLGLALPILILLGGIGLILGMMTACIGGWFDRVVTGISQVFIAFPTLIIAVAIIGVWEMACKILFGRLSSPCGRGLCSLFAPMPKRNLGGINCRREGVRLWNVAAYCSPFNSQYPSAVFGVFSTGVASAILTFPVFPSLVLACQAAQLNGAQCWRKRRWRCIPTRNCSFTPASAFSLPPQASTCWRGASGHSPTAGGCTMSKKLLQVEHLSIALKNPYQEL